MGKIQEVAFEYARDKWNNVLHITSAHSGANGYYCIGCNSAMIAYFGRRQPHFKHHPNDVEKSQDCTWSDETYRHKIAKEILQRLKEVQVPKVSIAVPKEYGTGNVTIAAPKTVKASSVLIERYIYEDEFGQIKIGKAFDDMEGKRHLLVKPDVIFLDPHNKPILIIELCATHKADESKRMKLMHLGIDSIEIQIPKAANPEEIEKNLVSTSNTKWLYSYEQAKTKFDPSTHLPNNSRAFFHGEPGDIPKGETIQCRTFGIRECIRAINKFMGSSDFTEGEGAIRELISRAEGNAARAKQELADRDRRARSVAKGAILQLVELERIKAKEIESEQESFLRKAEEQRLDFEKQDSDYHSLGERYYKKRDRLIREQGEVSAGENGQDGEMGRRREELTARIRELRSKIAEYEGFGRQEEHFESEKRQVIDTESWLREEEIRIGQEEKGALEYLEREERLRESEGEATKGQAANIRRMEEDICEMEAKQRRARESRAELARVKDRAIDARLNKRD